MAVSRAERRADRRARVVAVFGEAQADTVLDLFELTELAWHDVYNDITFGDDIVGDLLVCSEGDLGTLILAARLAVTDWRDLKMWARTVSDRTPAR